MWVKRRLKKSLYQAIPNATKKLSMMVNKKAIEVVIKLSFASLREILSPEQIQAPQI